MAKWIMTIDIERCENCNNCFLACKDEHFENDWLPHTLAQPRHGHRWMNILTKEQGVFPHISVAYMPRPCFHCADAPCMQQAKDGEIFRREDGIVIIDPEKSKGRQDLVSACPHGAIWYNKGNATPQKCTMCAHLLDQGWQAPRCVQACPTGALQFEKMDDDHLDAYIRENGLETARGHTPLCASDAPLVLYKNLDRFTTCFIAGSVATERQGIQDCVKGVSVELKQKGQHIATRTTDTFGDFRFTGLLPGSGTYDLELSQDGMVMERRQVELSASCSTGVILV